MCIRDRNKGMNRKAQTSETKNVRPFSLRMLFFTSLIDYGCNQIKDFHDDQSRHDHDQCDDAGIRPVAQGHGILVEECRQHHVFVSAQQLRCCIGGQGACEDEDAAHDDAWYAQRQDHLQEGGQTIGTQSFCCFHDFGVDIFDDPHQGDHHQRQEQIDRSDRDCEFAVKQRNRSINDACCQQEIVDDSFLPKDIDPGKTADNRVGQKRKKNQCHHQAAEFFVCPSDIIGNRDTEKSTKESDDQ
eukprot:TRINITY_DN16599_c0_g1_i1.p2 TRINITY_DN16599_c0_g1~~TRINITY_DN16599_c0_g1_i1.p2  ORF type:complete len:243 (-),score=0.64 TRINITY_DN16599_c0_g1_i1:162-890(-)